MGKSLSSSTLLSLVQHMAAQIIHTDVKIKTTFKVDWSWNEQKLFFISRSHVCHILLIMMRHQTFFIWALRGGVVVRQAFWEMPLFMDKSRQGSVCNTLLHKGMTQQQKKVIDLTVINSSPKRLQTSSGWFVYSFQVIW